MNEAIEIIKDKFNTGHGEDLNFKVLLIHQMKNVILTILDG